MSTLQINPDWRVTSDRYCWMVQRRRVRTDKETGEQSEVWGNESFHASLPAAVSALGEHVLRRSDAEGIAEIAATLDRLSTDVSRALAPVLRLDLAELRTD